MKVPIVILHSVEHSGFLTPLPFEYTIEGWFLALEPIVFAIV